MIGRHAFGDQYRATDFTFVPGPGKLTLTFKRRTTAARRSNYDVFDFPGAGVAHGDVQPRRVDPRGFARASFNYGLLNQLAGVSVDQEHDPQSL